MKIGIVDADLITRKKHRFPNLACLKLSGYYKELGYEVQLCTTYEKVKEFDKVFISKVFTDTPVPEEVLTLRSVEYGGTGFFEENAEPLPYEIEHHMPDYHLYDDWVAGLMAIGVKRSELKEYLDYSIGFTTRGCFRKCGFCINRRYNKVDVHSPLSEFVDMTRKRICLLDDNILGYHGCEDIFRQLKDLGKFYKYKQGMDIRLLTPRRAELLSQSKYDGDVTFAFDNIEDKEVIANKLSVWRQYYTKNTALYVLCGFDPEGNYDEAFWGKDIEDAFKRIKILMQFKCFPYITRYYRYEDSPYRGMYINLSRWCNQKSMLKTQSLNEFGVVSQQGAKGGMSTTKYNTAYAKNYPEIAERYYDMKWSEVAE